MKEPIVRKISNTEDFIHIRVNTHGSACRDQVKIDQRSEMTIQQKKSIVKSHLGLLKLTSEPKKTLHPMTREAEPVYS